LQTTAPVDTSIPLELPEEMEEQADASETLAQDDVPELPRDWKEPADVTRRNTRAEKVAAEKEAAKAKAKKDKKAAKLAKLAERNAKEEGAQFGDNARNSRTNSFKGGNKGHKGYNSWGDTSKMTAHLRQEYVCGKYA
jgi:membrane protein involved in colicin uptake